MLPALEVLELPDEQVANSYFPVIADVVLEANASRSEYIPSNNENNSILGLGGPFLSRECLREQGKLASVPGTGWSGSGG